MATPESKVYPVEQTDAEKRVAGLASFLQKMGGLDLPFNFGSSFEKDPRSAYQTAQNILQIVDPYQQGGVGEYLPGFSTDLARERNDPLGEALSYLDLIPGGGAAVKGASVFLLARKTQLENTLKTMDADPLLKGNQQLKNSTQKELDKVNKEITENARLKTQADEMIADPSKFGVSDDLGEVVRDSYIASRKGPTNIPEIVRDNRTLDETANAIDEAIKRGDFIKTSEGVQITKGVDEGLNVVLNPGERSALNLSLDRFDKRLFHGSDAPGLEKGLGSLKLFDDAGALYLAGDKADPRLSGFAAFDKTGTGQGSVYTIKPTFKKTFDTPGVKDYNKPEEMDYIREYLKSKNKDQATQGLMGIKQAITPLKNYRIGTHVPPQVDREFADFFQDMGYDSLRFRGTNRSLDVNPKTGLPYRDQSETIMSLTPEDSLEILNEMSFSDYLKYLRDPNIPK